MFNEKAIHQKVLEFLVKEICKFVNSLSPPIMTLYSFNKRIVKFGIETIF